ncbi:hypothetical protein HRH25_00510 [Flavisolibacter sp. BT320]|nr:hypothetical protein [Flavisolibacter longurius]
MTNNIFNRLFLCFALMIFSCSKDKTLLPDLTQETSESAVGKMDNASASDRGAIQVYGVGFFAVTGECEPLLQGAAYAVKMTGELEGCLYVFIDDFDCSPSGTYREEGREYFVGSYNGKTGTFWTSYKFEAKYEGCAANGAPLGAEIFGRCQHPVVKGSGTGGFDGVTGRLNFKDDVVAGNFPYKGHLKF